MVFELLNKLRGRPHRAELRLLRSRCCSTGTGVSELKGGTSWSGKLFLRRGCQPSGAYVSEEAMMRQCIGFPGLPYKLPQRQKKFKTKET